jgi:hypothetical protein
LDCFRLEVRRHRFVVRFSSRALFSLSLPQTDGGSGTAGSHWEQQDVGEEYMAGVANMPMVMSPLTLGFLQGVVPFQQYFGGSDQY